MGRRGLLLALLLGCGDDGDPLTVPDAGCNTRRCDAPLPPDAAAERVLAELYPGDVGIAADPAVVFHEDFEEGSLDAVVARWESAQRDGLALVTDVPPRSTGAAAIAMTAGGAGPQAADLYTRLPEPHDALYFRYHAKYASGVEWHHTSAWIGGYNPSTAWPNPQAGVKPAGDDRVSIAFEPVSSDKRLDFYDYWMNMHSGAGTFYGNTLIHDRELILPDDAWMCVELYVKLNPDPSSPAGAELAVWKDDLLIVHFTDAAPYGFWVQDKFCPDGLGDDDTCVTYAPPAGEPRVPLDLQARTTVDLQLNWIWPQNYVTSGPAGAVVYDDLVVATRRIGCLR